MIPSQKPGDFQLSPSSEEGHHGIRGFRLFRDILLARCSAWDKAISIQLEGLLGWETRAFPCDTHREIRYGLEKPMMTF
jgi:hypothetical protein